VLSVAAADDEVDELESELVVLADDSVLLLGEEAVEDAAAEDPVVVESVAVLEPEAALAVPVDEAVETDPI